MNLSSLYPKPELSDEERAEVTKRLGLRENVPYTLGEFENGSPVVSIWTGLHKVNYTSQGRKVITASFAYLLPASPGCVQVISWDSDRLLVEGNKIRRMNGPLYFEEATYSEDTDSASEREMRTHLTSLISRVTQPLEVAA